MTTSSQAVTDYALLDHEIIISSLRAGNHDESGTDNYYFTATLFAVRNTKEDLTQDLAKRPKRRGPHHQFAEIELPVLTLWQAEQDQSATIKNSQLITGDEIRILVAEAMKEFKVSESEIAVVTKIKLFEKNKKFFFFGEDSFIAEKIYYPIPPNVYEAPIRTNLKLRMTDNKGLDVIIKIKYKNPVEIPVSSQSTPSANAHPSQQDTQ